jgi:tryptophan 2,3-dioxygenase
MTTLTSFGLSVPDGKQRLTYSGYLKVPELTGLQELLSDPPQHDETLFIITHQTYELWFKQILHEIDGVIARLDAGRVLGAHRLLQRCIEIQRVLIAQVAILETMTPMDFLAFRDHLTPASGFQSAQFREIEFAVGSKNPAFLEHYPEDGPEREGLARRLEMPTLGDAFYGLLASRGFDLPADPPDVEEPGESEPHHRRMSELRRIYTEAEKHYDLFLLAESLIEFDEAFRLWRFRHVAMVERMIGDKQGTGGSTGAAYLRKTVERKFFPDLWEIRSYLGSS